MAVTLDWVRECGPVDEYVGQFTVTADAGTFVLPIKIRAAIFQPNRDNAETDNYGVTFTAGSNTITFQLIGTTSVTGTLVAWGDV